MRAAALTLAAAGLDPRPVEIAVEVGPGPCEFDLRGLPPASARESRVRVRAALMQLGIELNDGRVTVDLLPQDAPRGGGGYDLAIAVGILAALGHVPADALAGTALLGELSLTGAIKAVRGVFPMLRGAGALAVSRAIIPGANGGEGALVSGLDVREARHLGEIVAHLTGERPLAVPHALPFTPDVGSELDLAEMKGQDGARRAIEIAAAGGHNLLMGGPRGGVRGGVAGRPATILPPMTEEEALEVTAVHSVCGIVPPGGIVRSRPFRAPHHTLSPVALAGGGEPVRPGEVSLAHHGVLFLDELPEFRPSTIEALRQPLEDGVVTVSRARERITYPARPLLVGATNPCPCGFHGEPTGKCSCSEARVAAFQARIARPAFQVFDMRVQLRTVPLAEVTSAPRGESSAEVRERVIRARAAQAERARRGEVGDALDTAGASLLSASEERLGLSARGLDAVRRVARTIADLDGRDAILGAHVAEAIQLHRLPRGAS